MSKSPKKAAQHHCDKHVVKMIVESAQILASCHNISLGITDKKTLLAKDDFLSDYFSTFPRRHDDGSPNYYGLGYIHHGCVRWAVNCIENYRWLVSLGKHLCNQYWLRYGIHKDKEHSTGAIIDWFSDNEPNIRSNGEKTPFYLAVGDGFGAVTDINGVESAVETYRLYYVLEKSEICTWKLQTPDWFQELYKNVYDEKWEES